MFVEDAGMNKNIYEMPIISAEEGLFQRPSEDNKV